MSTACNIIILGAHSVGKTVLFNQITCKQAAPRSIYHNSVDTGLVSWSYGGKQIKIEVRDTICTSSNSLNSTLCRNLDIVLFVYSVDSRDSIDELIKWYEAIYKHLPPDIISCLVGNKQDKKPANDIAKSIDQIKTLTAISDLNCFQVSALTGAGINEMIDSIARGILRKQPRATDKKPIILKEIRTNTDDAYCCIN